MTSGLIDNLEKDNTRLLEKLHRVEREYKECTARMGIVQRVGSNSEAKAFRNKPERLLEDESAKKELSFSMLRDRIKGKESEISKILKDSNICLAKTSEHAHSASHLSANQNNQSMLTSQTDVHHKHSVINGVIRYQSH